MQMKPMIIMAIAICLLTVSYLSSASADSLIHTYDDLNRLTRVQYGDGTIIDYGYDEVGNRTVKGIYKPPVANFTASIVTGYAPLFSVNFTDTTTGNPASWVWNFGDGGSSSLRNPSYDFRSLGTYSVSLTASNTAGTNTVTKTSYISVQACPNSPVKIAGKVSYSTLQAAYNAAVDGDVIQSMAQQFIENFTANRAITITLDGGYTCDYSSNPDKTIIKGMPRTSIGTVTLKNFRISN